METLTLLCPGLHPPSLTQAFLRDFLAEGDWPQPLVVPPQVAPYGVPQVALWLRQALHTQGGWSPGTAPPLYFLGFSAGVVGAMGAAHLWQGWGGQVRGLLALDGWGVPLGGTFPIARLSHDPFTHWSSLPLGSGPHNFYADPPVPHLELWRSPSQVQGWEIRQRGWGIEERHRCSALEFMRCQLQPDG